MTDVNGIQPAGAARPVDAAAPVAPTQRSHAPAAARDVAEISDVARLAARIEELPDVRTELVQRVKAEIAAGTYETSERIEIAAARLTDELLGD